MRTFVHFHWTSIAVIPAIILTTYFYQKATKKRLINIGIGFFLVVFLTFRLYLMVQILPVKNQNVDYYHDRDLWAKDVSKLANGRAVVFKNNLREAGLYRFYSGEEGVALYSQLGKKSQFELWNYEEQLQSQPVLIVKQKPFESSQELSTRMGKTEYYLELDEFHSCQNIEIKAITTPIFENDKLSVDIEIYNPRAQPLLFSKIKPAVAVAFYKGKKSVQYFAQLNKPLEDIPPRTGQVYTLNVVTQGLNFEPQDFYIGTYSGKLDFAVVSDKININED